MILISHRGNLNGPDDNVDSNPEIVYDVIRQGYHCEVDVWLYKDLFYFGHDEPRWPVDIKFIDDNLNKLWLHAKSIPTISELLGYDFHDEYYYTPNVFYHTDEDVVLTMGGWLWFYKDKFTPSENSIAVLPEQNNIDIRGAAGVCSDYIARIARNKMIDLLLKDI